MNVASMLENIVGFKKYKNQPTFVGGVIVFSGVVSLMAESAKKVEIEKKQKSLRWLLLISLIIFSIAQLSVAIFGFGRLGVLLVLNAPPIAKLYAVALLLLAAIFVVGSLRLLPPIWFLAATLRGQYAK